MTTKIDFKKKDKELYSATSKPKVVSVPSFQFLMIDGQGDPNTSKDFQDAVEALYKVSYAIKMSTKKGIDIPGYFDYAVAPLEGVWDLIDKTKKFDIKDKNNLKWTIMIRQPEFVNKEVFEQMRETVKMENPALEKMYFKSTEEGLCCQIMHIGPYDKELETFEAMNQWMKANGYERVGDTHREIYLSNAQRTAPEKLKTILRYRVKKNS